MLVVVAHYALWTAVSPVVTLPSWIPNCGGVASTMGMSIFFTLSGFVIALTYSSWDWDRRPVFNLTRLFFYRFARLYPAFLVFALLIWMRAPKLHDFTSPETRDYLLIHLLLWQTWWPLKFDGWTAESSAFHVSWSLSTECMLYLLFGLGAIVVAALPRRPHLPSIVAAFFFAAILALLGAGWWLREYIAPAGWNDGNWQFWLLNLSPYARCLEFFIGVGAYRLFRKPLALGLARIASEAGGVGLVVIFVLFVTFGFPWGVLPFNLLVGLAAALLMMGARSNSFANRLLSGHAIVYLGMISYSLYLFHFITPNLAAPGWFQTFDLSVAAYYALHFLASLALAVALATGVYRLVEVPGRRLIRTAADRLLGLPSASAARPQGAPAE